MANNIKGITIEIGGETSGLQSALKGVNNETKSLQGELKNVEKLLNLDPGNTELLAQKQTLLTEAISNTKTKLDTLKEAERQVQQQFANGEISEEQYRGLQREIIATEQSLRSLETSLQSTNDKWAQFGTKAQEIGGKTEELGKKFAPVSAAASGAGILITKMASDFGDSMAKVNTIADTTKVPLETLSDQIIKLSNQTGIAATDIAEDVYNAISAGQDTADAVNFVEQSTKLAKAGFAESSQTLDILTTTLNAYGLEAEKVSEVSDVLVQVQNKGKTTVAELSANMGKIIPTAKQANVELDQLGAGYAILTANGIATAEATTYMNGMLNELSKTGSITDKTLREETGKGFAELSKEGYSVADALEIVNRSAQDSGLGLNDMFGSSEAAKAALVLLGDGADDFNDMVVEMNNSVGATDAAFQKMQTPSEELKKSLNELKNVGIELGQQLLPIVTRLAEFISGLAEKFIGLDESTQKTILIVGGIVAVLAPLLIIIGKVITAVGVIGTAISTVSGAIAVMTTGVAAATPAIGTLAAVFTALTGPIGIAVAAIAAVGIALTVLWNANEEFRNAVTEIWNNIKEFLSTTFSDIKEALSTTFNIIKEIVTNIFNAIKDFWNTWGESIKALFDVYLEAYRAAFDLAFMTIKTIVETVFQTIKTVVDTVLKIISTVIMTYLQTIQGVFKTIMQAISGDWSGAWNTLKTTCSNLLEGIKTIVSTALNGIKTVFSDLVGNAFNWGKNLISGFIDGIKSMIGKVKDAASSVTKAVSGYLGFNSPSKEGEGRFITDWGENMIGGFLDGVKNAIPDVSDVVGGATAAAGKALNSNTVSNNYSGGNVTINMYNPQVASKSDVNNISKQLQRQITTQSRTLGLA